MSNGNCQASVNVCNVQYEYTVGQQLHLTMKFYDQQTGAPVDPTTVSLTITDPELTETTYNYGDPGGEITRSAEGVYHYDLLLTLGGAYHYRWVSTGAGAGAYQSAIGVTPVGPIECPTPEQERDAAWAEAAHTPKRTRGDQGEIEERSADDKIKLDHHNRKQNVSRFDVLRQSAMTSSKYPNCR